MQPVPRYPDHPGFKRDGTSRDAADAMFGRALTLKTKVLLLITEEPRTADECAALLGETVLAIRPRLSELVKDGLIHDSGERRENTSGLKAKVMAAGAMRQRPTTTTTTTETTITGAAA